MRTVLLCLSLLLYAIRTIAFELSDIVTLTDRNGLSQNTVRCLTVDKRNFIWLGTVNGLNRYDGKNFTIIHPYQRQTSPTADSRIREITEDRYGFIWIRTFANAVCCYDPKQERIIDYAPQNTTQTFRHIRIMSDGELWMWGKKGCCWVNYIDGMPVSQLFHIEDLSSGHILFVFEDSRQRKWIGTQKALYCVEGNQAKQIREERFWDAAQSGDELYFAGEKGLTVLNVVNRTFISSIPLIPSDSHKKIEYAHIGLLNRGILLITSDRDTYLFDTNRKQSLSTESFFEGSDMQHADFLTDNRGNLWVYNKSGVLWRHHSDNRFEPLRLMSTEILKLITSEQFTVYHDSRDIYGSPVSAEEFNWLKDKMEHCLFASSFLRILTSTMYAH